MGTRYPVALVGEQHYASAHRGLEPGTMVLLRHEPANPHDDRAIAVTTPGGQTLGYLQRDSFVHRAMLDEGKRPAAFVLSVDRSNAAHPQLVVEVDLVPDREDADLRDLLASLPPAAPPRPERTGIARFLFGP